MESWKGDALVDAIDLAGFDQAVDVGSALATGIGSGDVAPGD